MPSISSSNAELASLATLTRWMDDRWAIPGTSIRFGLDAVLGLLPGIGDSITGVLSLWLVVKAKELDAPFSLRLRMIGNIIIDWLLGLVPVVGDLFDVSWRANRRNLHLLQQHLMKGANSP